jgi:hypothetical protein
LKPCRSAAGSRDFSQLFADSDNDEEFEGFGLDDILDNIDI